MSSGEFAAEDHKRGLEKRVCELEQQISALEQQLQKRKNRKLIEAFARQIYYESADEFEQPISETNSALLPIQNISRFPEEVAQEELGATVYRARFIWNNYKEFSHRAQGGRTIKAGELRRYLQAQANDDEQIYTATVGRVMKAMVDLTRGIVKISKGPDGERRLFVPNNWRELAEKERQH